MKTFLIGMLVCGILVAQLVPLTDQRIIELAHSGVHADELNRMIQSAPQINFDLSPGAEAQMMQAGVTEDTIRIMAAREASATVVSAAPLVATQQPKKHRNKVVFWTLLAAGCGLAAWGGYQLSNRQPNGGVVIQPFPGHAAF